MRTKIAFVANEPVKLFSIDGLRWFKSAEEARAYDRRRAEQTREHKKSMQRNFKKNRG
jgi:hypothetical protein